MAKAKKEGKPKRNSGNLVKNLKRIFRNYDLISKFKEALK
jgi:hypothetical protein